MPEDIETLKRWIEVCLVIAGLCASLIPTLYVFSTWNQSWLGRAFMSYTVTIALVLDITAIFQFWHPNDVPTLFWVNAVVFSLIAVSSIFLAAVLWNVNYKKHIRRRKLNDERNSSASS